MKTETWAAREVYFDNHGEPIIHRAIEPLNDAQIKIVRDTQGTGIHWRLYVETVRAVERAHGIGETQ